MKMSTWSKAFDEPLTNDVFCEELSYPDLSPTRKFGFQINRKVNL